MKYGMLKLALATIACLSVTAVAQIPTIKITSNSEPVTTTVPPNQQNCFVGCVRIMDYVSMTNFELTDPNNPRNDLVVLPENNGGESDSIRVRGNSTALPEYKKKAYRIKFDKKQSLFGRPAAKSWNLLANYYDQTFALNAIAFRLGKKIMPGFTPNSEFVHLYLNEQYRGIYQLTEQIQDHPGRVDIDKLRGFLVEFDFRDLESDQVGFPAPSPYTTMKNVRVRSPELGGCDTNPLKNCNINNDTVKFVQTEINDMFSRVDKNNDPWSKMDVDSWARYVLIQQAIDNLDFNSGTDAQGGYPPGSNYAYKDAGTKIFAGPLWDFDLAASVSMNTYPKHFYTTSEAIRPKNTFYRKLWDDNQFRCKFKEAWTNNKSFFETIPAFIDSIANVLAPHAQANFTTGLYETTSSFKPTIPKTEAEYKTEVGKLKTWWTSRMTFFDSEVNKLSASSCVPSPSSSSIASSSSSVPSSSSVRSSSSSSAVTTPIAIKNIANAKLSVYTVPNAIILQNVPANTKVELYNLRGVLIYSVKAENFKPQLQIGVQTKGMYIVKAGNKIYNLISI